MPTAPVHCRVKDVLAYLLEKLAHCDTEWEMLRNRLGKQQNPPYLFYRECVGGNVVIAPSLLNVYFYVRQQGSKNCWNKEILVSIAPCGT